MTAPTPERLAAIRARQARMPNGHAGSSQGELLDAVADRNTLLAWVDSLLRWQSEATEALTAWDKVWFAAGEPGPLGGSKANATAAEVDRLTKERDEWREADARSCELGGRYRERALSAEAEVDRLRAQAAAGTAVLDRYSNDEQPEDLGSPEDAWRLFRDLRAALASGDEVQP